MGKTVIWTILCFYLLPILNNVEKQLVKVASIYVRGSKNYIGREREFQTHFLKFLQFFVIDYLKLTTKTPKYEVLMKAVSNRSNLLQ